MPPPSPPKMVLGLVSRFRRSFTGRQAKTLAAFAVAEICQAVCVSLQAPFYPHEAEMKGATATEYGLVFGVFELVVFLVRKRTSLSLAY